MTSFWLMLILPIACMSEPWGGNHPHGLSQGAHYDITRINLNVQCTTSGPHQSQVTCSKGFPEIIGPLVLELTIVGASLVTLGSVPQESAHGFVQSQTLARLVISTCAIATIRPDIFADVPALKFLDLSRNQIYSLSEPNLRYLTQIEEINMSHNQIISISQDTFQNMHYLKKIDLSHNKIEDLKINFPSSISQLLLTKNQIQQLTTPLYLPELEVLDLCQNPLREIEASLNCPNMKTICVGDSNVVLDMNTLKNEPSLEDLSLHGRLAATQPLSGQICTMFETLQNLHEVEFLDYSLTHINFLPQLTDCTKVRLHRVTVVQPLVPTCFRNVVELDLSGSQQLVYEVVSRSEILGAMTLVKTLKLQNCDLTTLSWFPQLPNMQSCDIGYNSLSCDTTTTDIFCHEYAKGSGSKLAGFDALTCSAPLVKYATQEDDVETYNLPASTFPQPGLTLAKALCESTTKRISTTSTTTSARTSTTIASTPKFRTPTTPVVRTPAPTTPIVRTPAPTTPTVRTPAPTTPTVRTPAHTTTTRATTPVRSSAPTTREPAHWSDVTHSARTESWPGWAIGCISGGLLLLLLLIVVMVYWCNRRKKEGYSEQSKK